MGKRKTTEMFIEEAKDVHGEKYIYTSVRYVNNKTKVCIICPEHGEFWQVPESHLKGCGCPKCSGKYHKNTEDFIGDVVPVHGNKYDYSEFIYVNCMTKGKIICHKKDKYGNEHGEFWQTPNKHLMGRGCPKCKLYLFGDTYKKTFEDFCNEANVIHCNEYEYDENA